MNACACWAAVLAGILLLPEVRERPIRRRKPTRRAVRVAHEDYDAAILAFTEAIGLARKWPTPTVAEVSPTIKRAIPTRPSPT